MQFLFLTLLKLIYLKQIKTFEMDKYLKKISWNKTTNPYSLKQHFIISSNQHLVLCWIHIQILITDNFFCKACLFFVFMCVHVCLCPSTTKMMPATYISINVNDVMLMRWCMGWHAREKFSNIWLRIYFFYLPSSRADQ